MKIFLTITLDCECDKSWNWQSSNPLTFKNITYGIPNIIQPISDELEMPPTYLFSNEVLENDECLMALRDLSGKYEFGTHLHGDYIGPNKRFSNYAGSLTEDFQCHYNEIEEFEKLKNLTELFFNCFGYYPKSFRAGRFGMGKNTFSILKKLNYNIDTSVTPFQKWRHKKGDIDFFNYQSTLFFPLINGQAQNQLLEIPVSIFSSRLRNVLLPLSDSLLYERIIDKLFTNLWVRPSYSSFKQMKFVVDKFLEKKNDKPVIINVMFHSMEVIIGASPYVLSKTDFDKFLTNYRKILEYVKNLGGTGMTLSEIYSFITKNSTLK